MRYTCSICGYVYDEEKEKIPWAELPADWKCPLCGASKSDFVPEGPAVPAAEAVPVPAGESDMRELTAIEVSVLCSNLAKGCEKQYLPESAAAFSRLAEWFGSRSSAGDASFDRLLDKINADLETGFPAVNAAARQYGGAWSGARRYPGSSAPCWPDMRRRETQCCKTPMYTSARSAVLSTSAMSCPRSAPYARCRTASSKR